MPKRQVGCHFSHLNLLSFAVGTLVGRSINLNTAAILASKWSSVDRLLFVLYSLQPCEL
jgi:hypothetical protein